MMNAHDLAELEQFQNAELLVLDNPRGRLLSKTALGPFHADNDSGGAVSELVIPLAAEPGQWLEIRRCADGVLLHECAVKDAS